jgi:hypothetical protein
MLHVLLRGLPILIFPAFRFPRCTRMIKLLLASDNVISSYRCKSMIGYKFHAIMKILPNFRGNLVAAVAVQ